MMGKRVKPVSIEKVLEGCGVEHIATVNPMELDKAIDVVKETAALPGVKAIIFRYPCAAMTPKPKEVCTVEADRCIGCFRCIRERGWKSRDRPGPLHSLRSVQIRLPEERHCHSGRC